MTVVHIPQSVADWIEYHKQQYTSWDDHARGDFVIRCSHDLFNYGESGSTIDFDITDEISQYTVLHPHLFIRAIMDGYMVE